ncbi:superinfection exclusion B family protein [Ferrimonas senticii]|uniref:superinfection exclusion B family protein n=1 Tax=Ferrimonas senticii TaxID=394566 RepID=UPI00040B5BCC|nr:superinfection exclusion B family protein [Ferrimonas senticii]
MNLQQHLATPLANRQWLTLVALWLLLTALTLLLLPMSMLQSLLLQQWASNHGFWIGLTALASGSYLLAEVLHWQFRRHSDKRQQRHQLAQLERKIGLLDNQERAVLREFFLQANSLVRMPLANIAVNELLHYGVIEQIGDSEHYAIEGRVAQMRISDYAKPLLNRQILRIPEGTMTEAQRNQLLAARPEFIISLGRSRRKAA